MRFSRSDPSRVLVVYCHPLPDSFVAAARDRVVAGLRTTRCDYRLIDLYADGFDPKFSAEERAAHRQPGVEPELAPYAEAVQWCNILILVYPTWWAGQPAMLKGWFDRVWANGVAWELPDGANQLQPLLTNIERIVSVTTHGSPKYINMIEGEAGKRTVTRSLRALCSRWCRTSWIALYNVDRCSLAKREAFLDRVEAACAKLAGGPARSR